MYETNAINCIVTIGGFIWIGETARKYICIGLDPHSPQKHDKLLLRFSLK